LIKIKKKREGFDFVFSLYLGHPFSSPKVYEDGIEFFFEDAKKKSNIFHATRDPPTFSFYLFIF